MKKLTASITVVAAACALLVLTPPEEVQAASLDTGSEAIVHVEPSGEADVAPTFIRSAWCEVFPC